MDRDATPPRGCFGAHLRCSIEQGEHLFVTLRLAGKPVELVRFPAEGHELSRSGSPRHRVRRFEILLEWFDRHLKSVAERPETAVAVGSANAR